MFEKEGIDHFSVFDYNEAVKVKAYTSSPSTIMIMGWIGDKDIKKAIVKGFEYFVFNIYRLQRALKDAKILGVKAKIHLEVETGMNRSGLNNHDLDKAINIINNNREYFNVKGFCTHLAGAESVSNYKRIKLQLKKYNSMYSVLIKNNIVPDFRHTANSAAAFVYPSSRMDLVRLGMIQYGFWPSTETYIHYLQNKKNKTDPLKRILGWKSRVMAIKNVKVGEFIGYGISYLAQVETLTALIPLGYAVGYSRSLSNKGYVLIQGHFCSIIGIINMNMIIANVTDIPGVNIGDEVTIIGRQGEQEIKVSSFSDSSNKLNYEVLAHLSENIKRITI